MQFMMTASAPGAIALSPQAEDKIIWHISGREKDMLFICEVLLVHIKWRCCVIYQLRLLKNTNLISKIM